MHKKTGITEITKKKKKTKTINTRLIQTKTNNEEQHMVLRYPDLVQVHTQVVCLPTLSNTWF